MPFEVKHYARDGVEKDEAIQLLGMIQHDLVDCIRSDADLPNTNTTNASLEDLALAIHHHPKCLQRPIIVWQKQAIMARPLVHVLPIIPNTYRVHLAIQISGKVQGVYFRMSTKKMANEWALNGWVKNEPNGDVSAVFQGNPSAIHDINVWCKNGPKDAVVKRVQVMGLTGSPDRWFDHFEVIH